MCKTNLKMNIYYANICKHEYEKNMTRLWCKIVPKTSAELAKRNEGSYLYLYPFEDLPN
jgi:intracellular sulfur oxidation DsrE/DsrF family protein